MTRQGHALAAAVGLMLAHSSVPSSVAQDSSREALLTDQLRGAEYMMGFVGNLYVASLRCGIGDPQVWVRIAAALDRRIAHCASENAEWSSILARARKDAERDSPVKGQDVGYASLAFWKRVPVAERSFEMKAPSERCSSLALKRVLNPVSVSDDELAKGRQTMDPRVKAEFEMYEKWRTIVDDQKWIVAPCNTLWPN
jgi:hypothetical protein